MLSPIIACDNGGVEEKKEEVDPERETPATTLPSNTIRPTRLLSNGTLEDNTDEEEQTQQQQHGFQAQLRAFVKTIFGSCGSAIETATFYVQQQCGGGGGVHAQHHEQPNAVQRPLISIADELKQLAVTEGRPFHPALRSRDIPKFLGEHAVQDFEDDTISALSQHTLEEQIYSRRTQTTALTQQSSSTEQKDEPTSRKNIV
jgi:hypothetical protein